MILTIPAVSLPANNAGNTCGHTFMANPNWLPKTAATRIAHAPLIICPRVFIFFIVGNTGAQDTNEKIIPDTLVLSRPIQSPIQVRGVFKKRDMSSMTGSIPIIVTVIWHTSFIEFIKESIDAIIVMFNR